jgi:hypothetical protein
VHSMLKAGALAAAAALGLVACGQQQSSAPAQPSSVPSAQAGATQSKAADLRTKLDILLGEHLILAAKATGAALGGRTDEFKVYGDQLNANGTDIGAMVGAAYGTDAQGKFNQIWSAHDGFFVDYTTGVATRDTARMNKAIQDLTGTYVPQFSDLISGATGLPKDTVTQLTTQHVLQTKAVVDAQAAGDWPTAYKSIGTAYAHMQMIGDPLGEAIAKGQTGKFPGDAASKGADLRVSLNMLLQEHLYLASMATDAALGGRTDEFRAAGGALNANGTDIGAAFGSLFGTDAQSRFNQIWSAHNGFFVDYTTGVAKKDMAMQDGAVQDLTGTYVPQFAAFISGATGLPGNTVTDLTRQHVLTTKAIVDAQGSKDWPTVAKDDRAAAQHMQMIGDPLAAGIAAKLPQRF